MTEYKVLEPVEGSEEVTIEKVGHAVTFTVKDVQDHIVTLKKHERELLAQVELENAKMENVKSYHPVVAELTEEQIHAVSVYAMAALVARKSKEQLEATQKQLTEYAAEIEEIKKQTNVTI